MAWGNSTSVVSFSQLSAQTCWSGLWIYYSFSVIMREFACMCWTALIETRPRALFQGGGELTSESIEISGVVGVWHTCCSLAPSQF